MSIMSKTTAATSNRYEEDFPTPVTNGFDKEKTIKKNDKKTKRSSNLSDSKVGSKRKAESPISKVKILNYYQIIK